MDRITLEKAIYAFATGDALGVPFEFEQRGSFICSDMVGGGSHEQVAGTWSDDTSMVLATCKSLKDNDGKIVIDDIKDNFMKWVNEEAFTANGEVFDIGHATLKALMLGESQKSEYSNGNGSLMRVLPLAFVDCTDDDIRLVSDITHGHEISMEACVIYVNLIKNCLAGEDIEDAVHSLELNAPFDRLKHIDTLTVDDIKSSGYVVDSLEAAIWCVLTSKSFDECLLKAVNLGEDTDTIAALAGGLGVCKFDIADIPENWVYELKGKEIINECLF